jgi:hypothetical protein
MGVVLLGGRYLRCRSLEEEGHMDANVFVVLVNTGVTGGRREGMTMANPSVLAPLPFFSVWDFGGMTTGLTFRVGLE